MVHVKRDKFDYIWKPMSNNVHPYSVIMNHIQDVL
jgi:hypothetical protein